MSRTRRGEQIRHRVQKSPQRAGQSLVEYALIAALLILALIIILSITGPAVGNVFSNQVANLLNLTTTPEDPMSEGEFWDMVTAVASYTPQAAALVTNTPPAEGDRDNDGYADSLDNCPTLSNPSQSDSDNDGLGNVCDPDPGNTEYRLDTDGDGVLDNVDNCPNISNSNQSDADTDGIGDACESQSGGGNGGGPTGPTATPRDRNMGYPYNDDGNPNNWETDFSTTLKGPWQAEYWDYSGTANGQCGSGNVFNTDGSYTRPPKFSGQESELVFPRSSHPFWNNTSDVPPASGVTVDFCSRFTMTAKLTAGKQYTWRYRKDDGLRILVNGQTIVNDWAYNPNQDNYVETAWTVPSDPDGSYDVTILHVDSGWTARLEVFLKDTGLSDTGDCEWALSTEKAHTGPDAWSDSPGRNYANSSYCILRLRGNINLTGAQRPYLEWWNQYDIKATDFGWLAVREVGTTTWMLSKIHQGPVADNNWVRQEVRLWDLAAFPESQRPSGTLQTLDYRNKRIEVAFILDADATANGGGWWIDDFKVYEKVYPLYYMGFTDGVGSDNNPPLNAWTAEGTWGQTTSKVHSGQWAWTDSPSGNYASNTNSSLTLNGLLDLSTLDVVEPEIAFWHSWKLASGDEIRVEASTNEGLSWTPLKTSTSDVTNYLETFPSASVEYKQTTIPLYITGQDYRGQRIMVRFRIITDNSQAEDGWYIDDIQFRNRPVTASIRPDWCDGAENGLSQGNWTAEGNWGTTTSPTYNGSLAFTDSPVGNYTNNSNSALILGRDVDLFGTNNPVLEFWHRWELGLEDELYVEAYTPETDQWTTIWSQVYDDRPSDYSTSVANDGWNRQRAWQRTVVPLTAYVAGQPIKLRWRLNAPINDAVADGWYLDNICIKQMNDPVINFPWRDNFDTGSTNWLRGGQWATVAEFPRSGANSMHESPGADYDHYTDNILELKGIINLSGITAAEQPTLYYWERYNLPTNDRTYVEVIRVNSNGMPIAGEKWQILDDNTPATKNVAQTRRQFNLSGYVDQYIRLRFRLQSLNSSNDRSQIGWWLDDVALVLRAGSASQGAETRYPLPYNEGANFGAPDWVLEGSWTIVPETRSLGTGSSVLGPGVWRAEYRNSVGSPVNLTGTLWASENIADINFNWGSCNTCAPALVVANNDDSNKGNRWVGRYSRNVYFSEPTTINFWIQSDDGIRLTIDGAEVTNQWWDCGSCTIDTDYTFTAGDHLIFIDYYEATGGSYIYTDFSFVSGGVDFDPLAGNGWSTTYYGLCSDGTTIRPLPYNTPPLITSAIDYSWTDTAPQPVLDNNLNRTNNPAQAAGSGTVASPYQMVNEQAIFEAEVYDVTTSQVTVNFGSKGDRTWQVVTTPTGFSGTGAVQALPDPSSSSSRVNTSGTANGPRLDYKVNFPSAGTYYIAVRGRYGTETSQSDTIHVGLNGVASTAGTNFSSFNANYEWRDTDGNGNDVVLTVPSAGVHTVNIWMREDGVIADRIWVGKYAALSPRDTSCSHPNGTAYHWWLARYVRTITVSETTTFTMHLSSNDGHEVYHNGVSIVDKLGWGSTQDSDITLTLSPGTHTLQIDHSVMTGTTNFITLSYDVEGNVFHSDSSASSDYPLDYGASLILEGEVILPANSYPTLSWWEKYNLDSNDSIIVEVSTNGGFDALFGNSTTWTTVYSRYEANNMTWKRQIVDLRPFVNATAERVVTIRFRFDGLNSNSADPGWWVDDIQVSE